VGKTWGVGVVGLGHWYSAYGLARALPEYGKARLVGVSCADPTKRGAFATTFGIPGYDEHAALIARDDVDIVHLATPVA